MRIIRYYIYITYGIISSCCQVLGFLFYLATTIVQTTKTLLCTKNYTSDIVYIYIAKQKTIPTDQRYALTHPLPGPLSTQSIITESLHNNNIVTSHGWCFDGGGPAPPTLNSWPTPLFPTFPLCVVCAPQLALVFSLSTLRRMSIPCRPCSLEV